MNRSYSQPQGIDCSCFDFGLRPYPKSSPSQLPSQRYQNERRSYNKGENQWGDSLANTKKSLKRKNECLNEKLLATVKSSESRLTQKPREDSMNFQGIKNMKKGLNKTHDNNFLKKTTNQKQQKSSSKEIFLLKNQTSINVDDKEDNFYLNFGEENQSQKIFAVNSFNQNDKTIKKRSFTSNNLLFDNQPNMTIRYIEQNLKIEVDRQEKGSKEFESDPKFLSNNMLQKTTKRESKRDSVLAFAKKIRNTHINPRQIESSFIEEESQNESMVIEKGGYAWNKENQQKSTTFISSLHIRESARPQKMVIEKKISINQRISRLTKL